MPVVLNSLKQACHTACPWAFHLNTPTMSGLPSDSNMAKQFQKTVPASRLIQFANWVMPTGSQYAHACMVALEM